MSKEINILNSSKEEVTDAESLRQLEFIEKAKGYVEDMKKELGRTPRACVVTFGCQMNARDSEKLLAILKLVGYEESDSEDSEFVIYNTCTVRDNADQRVYGRLGQCSNFKKKNPYMKIALCGCMMQEQTAVDKIKKSYRFVDLIFGTHNIYKFAELLCTCLESDRMIIDIWKDTDKIVEDLPVFRKYPFKSGVNIMFGCNNFCTYCIVPYVRGRERSRSPKDIIRECEKLAADGVKEVMLLGQNVNSYGLDFEDGNPDKISFAQLIEEVCKVEGLERVRFMTPHPKDFSDELIETIKNNPKIARHIHLPLQSGNTEILRRMNRKYTKDSYLALVDKIRTKLPEVAITTDIIVGFPGETREDVDDTIDVVNKAHFDNAFTFIYSKRTGTPAAGFPDQVPEELVKENFDRLLLVVQENARKQAEKLQGRIEEVLVEGVNEHDSSLLTGRMSNNTLVHFPGDEQLIGSLVKVSLDECHGFYYMGKMV
ncbi:MULTISPECIES: tRNA (N6-isopentenyl adenosine(37)-C2)-methylthiotransferase MiaB [unclassified Butyrivibrio]|uniref:tRNA (N6-isopentenyl adenosine(37)-C2)-methylthiotransferase MiaB n=1 Tax=unclassified Butyrivibrio TaxID=2639466 RepID=UPI0003B35584|nr:MULTISPECIES: tRNA (N6-isopentenyl adenosine(37)-C2)-methylthiotransferase MiaB [unclassified Butyrivibrio]MDC7295207.1 tRNA (N6-isopentenyl adenosine(37)-C2)-methylthiotransferase MiaB [Butyrivibrio sp. DSM 10294]